MAAPGVPTAAAGRYLCLELASEVYALPLLSVHEVHGYAEPTPLPRMPRHVRGVTNLHGSIVPVIDLRLRVGIAAQGYDRRTVIVFVAAGPQLVGLIADGASRVLDLPAAEIQPSPEVADGVDVTFVAGVARVAERVVVVLDVDALLRGDPALAISMAAPPGAPPRELQRGR
jgi:purine-binding chemotaxis protein CheW